MNQVAIVVCYFTVLFSFSIATSLVNAQNLNQEIQTSAQGPQASRPETRFRLLPLPPGVRELKFSQIFKSPVGRLGLEITDELKQLDGRKVRIVGYMVHQTEPWSGAFLLAPVPVQLHEHEYGQADDLPASTIYVRMPAEGHAAPYTPGPMLITGTLHLGARDIEDERRTWVSVDMELPSDVQATKTQPLGAPKTRPQMQPQETQRKSDGGDTR